MHFESSTASVKPSGSSPKPRLEPLARIAGWPINIATREQAIAGIVAAATARHGFSVFTLNLDHLVKLRQDDAFRSAYAHADFITADGAPVAHIARRQCPSVERTTGADLLEPLCEAAAQNRIPVYFFGASADALARASSRIAQRCEHQIDIAGTDAPPLGFDPQGPEADAAIDRIAASGAGLCFVALGAPKQEIFAASAVARGADVGFICIGAAVDFVAGTQTRAPQAFQRHGLEWLWRLALNPRRLATRYAKCALMLADIEFRDRFSARHTPASAR